MSKLSDLASLKTEVGKMELDKLKTVPADLSELSDTITKEFLKKTAHDKLFANVNAIDTSGFVLKA